MCLKAQLEFLREKKCFDAPKISQNLNFLRYSAMPLYTNTSSQISKMLFHLAASSSLSHIHAAVLTTKELAEGSRQDRIAWARSPPVHLHSVYCSCLKDITI